MHVIVQAHTGLVSEICFIHSSCSAFLYEGHLLIYIQTLDLSWPQTKEQLHEEHSDKNVSVSYVSQLNLHGSVH